MAYQVWGEGPVDLVVCGGGWTVDVLWDHPRIAAVLDRLGGFARNIWLDARGSGASSRASGGHYATGLDVWVEDLNAVTAAVGSERTTILGVSEGAAAAVLYTASHPERVSALVLVNGLIRFMRASDYPLGFRPEEADRYLEAFEANWATMSQVEVAAPSMLEDTTWCQWWRRAQRLTLAPNDAAEVWRTITATDTHHVLPSIQAPTLVVHRRGNRHARVDHGRYIADRIPGAIYRELDGDDHMFFAGDTDELVDEIEEFITGVRPPVKTNRALVTLLFTDIVASSERAAELGDEQWRVLLDAHDAVVRSQLARFGGREVNTTGDGFLATFDGPARAIRCAADIVAALRPLGVAIRAGAHTGEVELRGDDVGGVAVNTTARIQSLAEPGEVLVSRTVTDLVAGSGLNFVDRGEHDLRGIPGRWRLFALGP